MREGKHYIIYSEDDIIGYQSFRLTRPGLDRLRPPRSKGGRTLPPTMVSRTMASQW